MFKKILTLDDLISFCRDNKFYSFDSKGQNNGEPLVVQVPNISELVFETDSVDEGMIYPVIRVCHTLLNANGSYVSEDNMAKAMPTLKYRPLLAKIHQLDDGTWDFHSHDIHIEKDKDGIEQIVYDEQQIGCITSDEPYLEYDEDMKKTYVVAKGAIPEEYTMAADIIKNKGGTTKVSCELYIYSMSYNAKEKYLELEDFRFNGCTLLGSHKNGKEVKEGMKGSKLTLNDFSEKNNSVIKIDAINNKLDKILNSLDFEDKKGGGQEMNKFAELLEKYGKAETDIEFEHTDLSDEELETKFEEMFGEKIEPENEHFDNKVISYEISHDDIRYALYELLRSFEETDNTDYYISNVFDTYFVYESWNGNAIYGQAYTKDSDNVALSGERYNLHKVFLTDSEYAELETMRSNYDELVQYKDNSEKAILLSQKEEVLGQEKYSVLTEKDETGGYVNTRFAALVKDIDKYSVDELEKEAKVILADYFTENSQNTFAEKAKPVIGRKKFSEPSEKKTNNRYGSLKFN